MRLEWRGRTLVITWLPVGAMGRLAALSPRCGAAGILMGLAAGRLTLSFVVRHCFNSYPLQEKKIKVPSVTTDQRQT